MHLELLFLSTMHTRAQRRDQHVPRVTLTPRCPREADPRSVPCRHLSLKDLHGKPERSLPKVRTGRNRTEGVEESVVLGSGREMQCGQAKCGCRSTVLARLGCRALPSRLR